MDTTIGRALGDGVITRAELRRIGAHREAKQDPASIAAKLDRYTERMTPSTYDAFTEYRSALDRREPAGEARIPQSGTVLQILTGKVATPPKLPRWYPAGYDLAGAADKVKAMLIAQGEKPESIGPGLADRIVFTDADLTLIKSTTPTLLKHRVSGELMRHPETGRLLLLGTGPERDWKPELRALKQAHPELAWKDYEPEYSEFSSLSDILRSPEIKEAIEVLHASDGDPKSRDFVITARSADNVAAFLDEYLAIRGLDINGVFAVSNPGLIDHLDLNDRALDAPRRKAIVMAAIITAYDPTTVRSVEYRDDSDHNLVAAMQLLPKMFPGIEFTFFDVFNEDGQDVFDHRLVARTDGKGELVDAKDKPLSVARIADYNSKDHYPIDPVFVQTPR